MATKMVTPAAPAADSHRIDFFAFDFDPGKFSLPEGLWRMVRYKNKKIIPAASGEPFVATKDGPVRGKTKTTWSKLAKALQADFNARVVDYVVFVAVNAKGEDVLEEDYKAALGAGTQKQETKATETPATPSAARKPSAGASTGIAIGLALAGAGLLYWYKRRSGASEQVA